MRLHRENPRATEAERILDDALAAARRETPHPASAFAVLRSRTEAHANTAGEHTVMATITHSITRHRSLSYGVVFAALVFAFVTLVPFEYQRTIGYTVTYAGIEGGEEWTPDQFATLLEAIGCDNVDVQITPDGATRRCVIAGLPSRHAVREANGLMASAVGFDGQPTVTPEHETVSGSLFAQVKDELDMRTVLPAVFSDLDLKNKTDEEITTELRKRLEERGCASPDIRITTRGTNADGTPRREVMVKLRSDADTNACLPMAGIDLEDLNIQDPAKTDDEVIAQVEERLKQNGITDVKVSVLRDPNGERQIMIMKEKDCR